MVAISIVIITEREVSTLNESESLSFWATPIADNFNGAAGTMEMICIGGCELSFLLPIFVGTFMLPGRRRVNEPTTGVVLV
jgi:hypothetical protein